MSKNETFEIRAYGRTELAQMYMPNLSASRAWRKLQEWIAMCPGLRDRLAQYGYNGCQRTWTPRQVEMIVEVLGEP